MDSYERQILQLVVRWAPFGGPREEDVLPSFGLTLPLLARRFTQIVSSLGESWPSLDDDDRQLFVAARRIACGMSRPPSRRRHHLNNAALNTASTPPLIKR